MTFEILGTGSAGNAVILNNIVLVDCGLPWKRIRPYAPEFRLVLLTHVHQDHFSPAAVRALANERPALRWGCCEWMVVPLLEAGVDKRRIDVYEVGETASYSASLSVTPVYLVHNVPNCGYKLTMNGERIFYATDTGTLDGIQAPNFDWYFVEANHTKEDLEARIKAKKSAGEYAYEYEAKRNHLSQEQAENWLYQQMGPKSKYVFLHIHIHKGGKIHDKED